MKTLSKFTISAVLITYGFVVFTILSSPISVLTGNPIFLTVGLVFSFSFFLFFFVVSFFFVSFTGEWKGIFSHLEDAESSKTWLLLHSFFTFITGEILPLVAGISSTIPLISATHVNSFATNLMFTWMIALLSIIGLWSLNLIIGMGYRWLCKGTALGIQSFSSFALQRFKRKERGGVADLLKALVLLKDCLKHEELELQELNGTIRATRCFLQFQCEIPYDDLEKLALELKRFPSIEHLPKTLSTFNDSSKVQWTGSFTATERTKRTVLELIVAIATILSGLTFLPEATRTAFFVMLRSIGTAQNIQVIMGFFLLFITIYLAYLIKPYYLDPLEAKKFKLSKVR